jgi:hypothetical protein
MGNEMVKAPELNMTQCFMCNGWTPTHLLRHVTLEGTDQMICIACYRKLKARMQALELEAIREAEELEPDEETKAAFASTESEED